MDSFASQVNCPKIIVDTTALNESGLVPAHQAIVNAYKPVHHALCDQLAEAVDEAYWPEVPNLLRIVLFPEKHHICIV